jgi:hypothetical protein
MSGIAAEGRSTRYPEAILLGLLIHDLIAGAVAWLIGLPGIATALWAIGAGLILGYLVIWLVGELRGPRRRGWLAGAVGLLLGVALAAVLGAFALSDALAVALLGTILIVERRSDRRPAPGGHRRRAPR